MNNYTWEEKFSVGNSKLDAQHQQIFTALREVQLALYDDVSPKLILSIIKELQSFVVEHFALEEEKMEPHKDNIPFHAEHIQQHLLLIYIVDILTERFKIEGAGVAQELHDILYLWLGTHIKEMDIKSFAIVKKLTT